MTEPLQHGPMSTVELIAMIKRYIKNPPPTSRVITFTPELAEWILANINPGNRPKKSGKIIEYAAAMTAQRWALNGETVTFSDAGRLANGQNRMAACVRAGVSFTTHVIFGVPDESFDRMDIGKNRNPGDVLAIAGFKNTTALAGALRWTHLIETGTVKSRTSPSPAETLELIRNSYPGLPAFVPDAISVSRYSGQPPSIAGAILYLTDEANHERAVKFAEAWTTGSKGGVFGKLSKAIGRVDKASTGRVHDVVRAAFIVQAWNLFVAGHTGTLSSFNWSLEDTFPTINKG